MTKRKALPLRFKKRWVAALRSKKYKQTRGVLHDTMGFCCLGVACAIQRVSVKKLNGCPMPSSLKMTERKKLPLFFTGKGRIYIDDENALDILVKMNDDIVKVKNNKYKYRHRYNFRCIAAWIERNL